MITSIPLIFDTVYDFIRGLGINSLIVDAAVRFFLQNLIDANLWMKLHCQIPFYQAIYIDCQLGTNNLNS